MRSKTISPTERSGQTLVEFVVQIPVTLLLLTALLAHGLGLAGQSFLWVNAYATARAHLYGNELDRCAPSHLWPRLIKLRVGLNCTRSSSVHATLGFDEHVVSEVDVDLQKESL